MKEVVQSNCQEEMPSRPRLGISRGVYFLANDSILDLALAFLNSLRISNPSIPLCLIPFASDIDRLKELSDLYNFIIYENHENIRRCDEIACKIFGRQCGQFRKLCAFDGPFDEFLYIDCDTVLISDPYFAFQHLSNYDFIFSHSDTSGLRRWVWKDSIFSTDLLNARQIAFSANTGFFCSRKQEINLHSVEKNIDKSMELVPHMELLCAEQPYLNYLVITSGKRYTSLLRLSESYKHYTPPLEKWAGGNVFRRDSVSHKSKNIFLYHWAGCWSADHNDRRLYSLLAKFGLRSRTPQVKLFMPRKNLWKRYRHMKYDGALRFE